MLLFVGCKKKQCYFPRRYLMILHVLYFNKYRTSNNKEKEKGNHIFRLELSFL